jgi:hypothetical protein
MASCHPCLSTALAAVLIPQEDDIQKAIFVGNNKGAFSRIWLLVTPAD